MPRFRHQWWLLLLAVALGVLLGWWLRRPAQPPPMVRIEDGRTIDFSSGQAVIKNDAENQAALERGQKEIDEAVADVTFAPTKPPEKSASDVESK